MFLMRRVFVLLLRCVRVCVDVTAEACRRVFVLLLRCVRVCVDVTAEACVCISSEAYVSAEACDCVSA